MKFKAQPKYYWRKKKEHFAWFEDVRMGYLSKGKHDGHVYCNGLIADSDFFHKFTEAEARDLLKDDFDKFEKVECE